MLQDPSFENGPPRVVNILDAPWGGEDETSGDGVFIVRGVARTGTQSARLQAAPESVLWQRFPVTPSTDYTATCWIKADPALGTGSDSPAFSIRRTDVICPVTECDDDGDEDLDHSEFIARIPIEVQSTAWEPLTLTFNAGPYVQLAVHVYSVLSGSQFILVDDCSVTEGGSPPVPEPPPIEPPPDPTRLCTDAYGATNGFQLCFATNTQCGFEAVKTGNQSCQTLCRQGGGQCQGVYRNNPGNPCVATSKISHRCTEKKGGDDICVCSL